MKSVNYAGKRLLLSDRLSAVADMVTTGNTVCDVGCDHGFVSVYLAAKGISPKIIAMDVNAGPLLAAAGHIADFGLTDYIEARLSNGVESLLTGEADTLICAGMGGRLMIRILKEGREKIEAMKELILQPQSELQRMREYLREQGYIIADENIILEEGKYYPIMKVCIRKADTDGAAADGGTDAEKNAAGKSGAGAESRAYTDDRQAEKQRIEDKYGPVLLRVRNPVLHSYLLREKKICGQILDNLRVKEDGRQEKRRCEVLQRLADIEAALARFE